MDRTNELQEWAVAMWNRTVRRGSLVGVTEDDGSVTQTETRSPAWRLGCGTPVVSVVGKDGGYLLTRVLPRKAW